MEYKIIVGTALEVETELNKLVEDTNRRHLTELSVEKMSATDNLVTVLIKID